MTFDHGLFYSLFVHFLYIDDLRLANLASSSYKSIFNCSLYWSSPCMFQHLLCCPIFLLVVLVMSGTYRDFILIAVQDSLHPNFVVYRSYTRKPWPSNIWLVREFRVLHGSDNCKT